MIILLLASLSCICSSNYIFYYKSHDYEFDYNEIINKPNNNILINDIANNILITILNSSSLSYILNNNHQLNFFDHTNFDEISYKHTIPTTLTKRRMPGISENNTPKSGIINAEASGKTMKIGCSNGGNIQITQASYGKNCNPSNLNNQLKNLQTVCNNKATCKYKINHRKIGDPARGCAKTYEYQYKCSTGAIAIAMYDIPKMNIGVMKDLHSDKHRKAFKTHLSQIKESILNEMKQSFKENNKQSILLQKIDDLKHEQSELDLQEKILQVKKAEQEQVKKEKNRLIKQEISYEKQARHDRQKLMRQKQKFMRERHALRMKEHKELMNGLKEFISSWKKLIPKPRAPTRTRVQQWRNKYDRNGNDRNVVKVQVNSKKLPMPPLPIGIIHEMGYSHRRLMLGDDGFGEIRKCVYTQAQFGGQLCIKYNDKKDIVSFQIISLIHEKFKEDKYIQKSNTDVNKFMVYEYRLELNEIHKCGNNNDNGTLPFGLCFLGNNDVVIYFDESNNKFNFNWIDDNQWDEIINFESRKSVTKCVNLQITKICVSNNGDNVFVVELTVPLID